MNMIVKQNAENYKNLTGFTDVFSYLYATEKYNTATESYGNFSSWTDLFNSKTLFVAKNIKNFIFKFISYLFAL